MPSLRGAQGRDDGIAQGHQPLGQSGDIPLGKLQVGHLRIGLVEARVLQAQLDPALHARLTVEMQQVTQGRSLAACRRIRAIGQCPQPGFIGGIVQTLQQAIDQLVQGRSPVATQAVHTVAAIAALGLEQVPARQHLHIAPRAFAAYHSQQPGLAGIVRQHTGKVESIRPLGDGHQYLVVAAQEGHYGSRPVQQPPTGAHPDAGNRDIAPPARPRVQGITALGYQHAAPPARKRGCLVQVDHPRRSDRVAPIPDAARTDTDAFAIPQVVHTSHHLDQAVLARPVIGGIEHTCAGQRDGERIAESIGIDVVGDRLRIAGVVEGVILGRTAVQVHAQNLAAGVVQALRPMRFIRIAHAHIQCAVGGDHAFSHLVRHRGGEPCKGRLNLDPARRPEAKAAPIVLEADDPVVQCGILPIDRRGEQISVDGIEADPRQAQLAAGLRQFDGWLVALEIVGVDVHAAIPGHDLDGAA